ncbi:hypothetical protein [Streptomyces sp900116325]|uniref:Uncharacterized protein n=1 Tax=Streptomyces sp. 900116325 TaxID=3154295 RepID=A0ABV2UHA3_9ACTN
METCHGRTDRGWVRGADLTLRLANHYRPAEPEKSGDAKKAPATITTCAGAPGDH